METNTESPYAACAMQILEVVPAVMRAIRGQMRSHRSELSVVQFRALAYLNRWPGASLSGLAEHIGLSLPTASKLVQTLLVRGYLRRKVDPRDRRRTALTPTAKGRRILTSARKATRAYLAEALRALPKEQCIAITAAMQTLLPLFLTDLAATPLPTSPNN